MDTAIARTSTRCLRALLSAVGVKAVPALVSTRMQVNTSVPAPAQFDHMITALTTPQGLKYLDTTAEVAPFCLLTENVRGKDALLLDGTSNALVKIPTTAAIPAKIQFHLSGDLDKEGTLHAKVTMVFEGDIDMVVRAGLRSVSQAQWNDFAQGFSRAIGFIGTVTNASASALNAIDEPLTISYDYERTEMGDWPARKILAPLPPFGFPDPDRIQGRKEDQARQAAERGNVRGGHTARGFQREGAGELCDEGVLRQL